MNWYNKTNRLRICYKILSVFISVLIGIFAMLFLLSSLMKNKVYPLKHKESVICYAKNYNLEESLVFAIIKVESNFNSKAISKKGAQGLMQIKSQTAEFIGKNLSINEFDLFKPETNINFGCYYFRYLINKFNNIDTALCAYNAGEGTIRKWLENPSYSPDGFTLKEIPYKETKNYLIKIKSAKHKYEKLYPKLLTKL